jgi:hypothetical protein
MSTRLARTPGFSNLIDRATAGTEQAFHVVLGTRGQPQICGRDSIEVGIHSRRRHEGRGLDLEGASLVEESSN